MIACPAPRQKRAVSAAGAPVCDDTHVHPLVYRLFGRLRRRDQELLVRLLAPSVTLGVAAIIADAQERLLVLHHTYRRPAWDFPSGLVNRGEQPDAALARELREELGVAAEIGPLLHADHDPRRRHLTLYYRATIAGEPRHDVETDGHRFVRLDELAALSGTPPPHWLRDVAGVS